MIAITFRAGAYGAAVAVAVAVVDRVAGFALDPITAWLLCSAGYILGSTELVERA